jgi:hypothetical protein
MAAAPSTQFAFGDQACSKRRVNDAAVVHFLVTDDPVFLFHQQQPKLREKTGSVAWHRETPILRDTAMSKL